MCLNQRIIELAKKCNLNPAVLMYVVRYPRYGDSNTTPEEVLDYLEKEWRKQ